MKMQIVRNVPSSLPSTDDHPYRTGAWRPNLVEYDAWDLDVSGAIPADLCGTYLRNTENPIHDSIGRYHPFDGDGMLHSMTFGNGSARYANRMINTQGLAAENEAGHALWPGLAENPAKALRPNGWGARGHMKDASSTDVVVHGGVAKTSFYQCGDLYLLDPVTLADQGRESWSGAFPAEGVSAHTKVDIHTGEMLFFNYSKHAPYMNYGVVDAHHQLVHYTPIPLPGPRLPHDMAFTTNYAILNDCPMFWDPDLLTRDVHAVRYFPDLPTRFAIIPRRGTAVDVRWFEAAPTYVLHWINAFEDGDDVVLDGYFQDQPSPASRQGDGAFEHLFRFVALDRMETRPHRWRFNMRTGAVTEHHLDDRIQEFGMINNRVAGLPYRYSYAVTGKPGWFLFNGLVKFDAAAGRVIDEYKFDNGVFASEAPFAPRTGSTSEDDGYLVTFITDTNRDCSECLIFDAQALSAGPVARVALPERICSGTHSWFEPAAP